MKNRKKILAIAIVIFLVVLYLCTFIFALIGSDVAQLLFKFSLGMSVVVPVLLYAFLLFYKLQKKGKDSSSEK